MKDTEFAFVQKVERNKDWLWSIIIVILVSLLFWYINQLNVYGITTISLLLIVYLLNGNAMRTNTESSISGLVLLLELSIMKSNDPKHEFNRAIHNMIQQRKLSLKEIAQILDYFVRSNDTIGIEASNLREYLESVMDSETLVN
jgi:hypothetical protein